MHKNLPGSSLMSKNLPGSSLMPRLWEHVSRNSCYFLFCFLGTQGGNPWKHASGTSCYFFILFFWIGNSGGVDLTGHMLWRQFQWSWPYWTCIMKEVPVIKAIPVELTFLSIYIMRAISVELTLLCTQTCYQNRYIYIYIFIFYFFYLHCYRQF